MVTNLYCNSADNVGYRSFVCHLYRPCYFDWIDASRNLVRFGGAHCVCGR